jgi:DNA-binding NarL/FixJ family response regulator
VDLLPYPPIRVVLVEDDDRLRALVERGLRSNPSTALVGSAPTGAEAATLCATRAPDVVVIDLGLPDMEGGDIIASVRDQLPTVSIVVFTGQRVAQGTPTSDAAADGADKRTGVDLLVQAVRRAGTEAGAASVEAELTLEPSPDSPAHARAFTQQVLTGWSCDGLIEDAQLIISELVTNAIRHAGSGATLWLRLTAQTLRITVADEHRASPRPLPFSLTRRHGRGLMVVSALAAAWGVEPHHRGKAIWAELSR